MDIVLFLIATLFVFGGIIAMVFIIFHLITREKKSRQHIIDLDDKLKKIQAEFLLQEQKIPEPEKNMDVAKLIVAQVSKGIIFIDQNRTIQFLNPYAEQFIDSANPIGQRYQNVLRLMNSDGNIDASLFVAAYHGSVQMIPDSYSIVCKRGAFPISGSVLQLKQDNIGTVAGIVLFFEDNGRQIERIKEEKAFFSAAAHELRTPITMIRTNIFKLRQDLAELSKEEINKLLLGTDETAVQLLNLVNEFLNISRVEQGRLEVNKEQFDIQKLTEEVINELHPLAQERTLSLNHTMDDLSLRMVIGDRSKAKEVLTNLVSNAIKYTPQGIITITHADADPYVATNVIDTGIGIPRDNQSLLFKRFQQIGNARTQSSAKSTGFGLYMSKKLAQLMHGDLVLEKSEPGSGSTFTFLLQRANRSQ